MSFLPTYGKKSAFKRNVFQAVISKSANKSQSEQFSSELKNLDVKCIWVCIVARTPDYEYSYEEEEGASSKLSGLLKRMAISGVIVGVRLWPDGSLPQHDVFRMMISCSKDLLIDFVTPVQTVKEEVTSRRPHVIELETVSHEGRRTVSFDSLGKNSSVKIPMIKAKTRQNRIIEKIQESDIKALQDFINHSIIGKLLIVLLVLLQKQKPTTTLARQFFASNNIQGLMKNLDLATLSKVQLARASKLFKTLSDYPSSYFEKISKPAALIFEFVKSVLSSDNSLISLPSVQKRIDCKGEYLKSKYVVFNVGKEIVPEAIPEIKESTPTPEPDPVDQLKNLSIRKNRLDEGVEEEEMDQVFVDEKFKMARKNRLEEEAIISRLINLNPDDIDPEVKIDFVLTDDDVIKFLANEELENQPTDLLLKLAARLKERRERHSLG